MSDKDKIKKRVEAFEQNLPPEHRDPNAKEKFDELTKRAAQPEKSAEGKPAQSDSYNGK